MTALLTLVLALQQAPAPGPATPPPATAKPAPVAPAQPRRTPAATASSLQVRVTDRTGTPASGVQVKAEGPVSRDGVTDTSGQVQFRTLRNGTYRIRASGDAFITLEKEFVVRAGVANSPIELALSAAPPPPAPPPPPEPVKAPEPAFAVPAAKAGDSRVLSIADLAERSLGGRDPIKLVPVGCSGLDTTTMVVLREALNAPPSPNIDQMLYVVAGEATLALGGHEQSISSGWFALVPRGMPHTLTRRGRNPVIVLTTSGGQPCAAK